MAELQRQLAAALRAAEAPLLAQVDPRRLAVYRELVRANIDGLLQRNFPVLRRIASVEQWEHWVRAFLLEHEARSPYFLEIGREFVDWLQQRQASPDDPPFLAELAHYEWVELALAVDPAELPPAVIPIQPLAAGLALSPLAWPLEYRWPVHQIGPGTHPASLPAEPTRLLAYRDRSGDVRFMALTSATAALLTLLADQPGQSGRALLEELAVAAGYSDPGALVDYGEPLLRQLIAADVILAKGGTAAI